MSHDDAVRTELIQIKLPLSVRATAAIGVAIDAMYPGALARTGPGYDPGYLNIEIDMDAFDEDLFEELADRDH